MPSYGKQQKPAGVDKSPVISDPGKRTMRSANALIKAGFSIKNCEYKGNAVFNAND